MILLENGCFHLSGKPKVTAILVDEERIVAVGETSEELQHDFKITRRYNLKGNVVWPGLTDSHLHLTTYGLNLLRVNCETDTLQECLKRVETAAIAASPNTWVLGHGWNQNIWQEGYGTASQLDSVSHDHPVYLTAKSLHASWANSLALNYAHVTTETTDPPGGSISRDRHGNPNGILLEKATELISSIIPKPSPVQINHAILEGMNSLLKMGVTSVHDFDPFDRMAYYNKLEREGRLHLRILKVIPPDDHQEAMESGQLSGQGHKLIHIGPYKYFMDGALGPQTAAMIEPYNNNTNNYGILNHKAEDLVIRAKTILENKSDISIHAIGDRANQEAINVFRSLRQFEKTSGLKPSKMRIEHVQLLQEDNLADLAEIGVTASMQPLHATSDMKMANEHWGLRTRFAYAWKSLLKHGTRIVFGSDAPVESPNPFWGMHAAVTRQLRDGTPTPEGWIPDERITLTQALIAYTTSPAELFGIPSTTGRLEPGSYADLIVLSADPFKEKAQELHHIKPVATMFAGQWVWVDQGIDL